MYNLLIVDDEAFIADGLRILFEGEDLELKRVTACYSAGEARELLEAYPFDIIISDINMPEKTGLAFLSEVRATNKRIKCIFLTGYDSFHYAKQAIHLNAFEYLLKPAEDSEVIDCVRRAIRELDVEMNQLLEVQRLREKLEESRSRSRNLLVSDIAEKGVPVESLSPLQRQTLGDAFDMGRPAGLALVRVDSWGADSRLCGPGDLCHIVRSLYLEMAGGVMLLCGMARSELMAGIFQSRERYGESFMLRKFEEIQDFLFNSMGIQVSYALTYEARWEEMHLQFGYQAARLGQNLIPGQIIRADLSAAMSGHGGVGQRSSEQFIAGVKQYVQHNVSGDLSLDQLSGKLQINPCYLSRVFREITGETLSGYINESRMSEAKRLLNETGEKIYHIATRVGFQNSNYFAKAFRKSVGVSPQEYRLSSRMMSCG